MPEGGPQTARELSINLDAIVAPSVVDSEPDKQSKIELENEEKSLHNRDLAQTIEQRKTYAFRIFILVSAWLVGVYLILVFQGFAFRGFKLPDNILLAAIGSTTANIIAILVIIVKYLFPNHQNHQTSN